MTRPSDATVRLIVGNADPAGFRAAYHTEPYLHAAVNTLDALLASAPFDGLTRAACVLLDQQAADYADRGDDGLAAAMTSASAVLRARPATVEVSEPLDCDGPTVTVKSSAGVPFRLDQTDQRKSGRWAHTTYVIGQPV